MAQNAVAPSALSQVLGSHLPVAPGENSSWLQQYNLALQVLHNLEYQHRWTNLKNHGTPSSQAPQTPRILLSGLPPTRLYVHPDEQVEIIKAERERARQRVEATNDTLQTDSLTGNTEPNTEVTPEPEWVLPTHLKEEWTLERLAKVFDEIEAVPPGYDTVQVNLKWRQTKRLLMAILQDDSTVVYYIVHDGIVKPRQN
jgi:tRNA-splicing endonuclease subunit Sen15, fungi type